MTQTAGTANEAMEAIKASYAKAREKHAPMRGPHEGYAVLLEELDELWDEVKRWQPMPSGFGEPGRISAKDADYNDNMRAMRKEALHVAAMALAFLLEVCE